MRNPRQIRIEHPRAHQLYNYILGHRLDPGAQAEIFEPLFSLPMINFRGPSRLAGTFQTIQPPQLTVQQALAVAGIPTTAGQLISQPLMVPDDASGN